MNQLKRSGWLPPEGMYMLGWNDSKSSTHGNIMKAVNEAEAILQLRINREQHPEVEWAIYDSKGEQYD